MLFLKLLGLELLLLYIAGWSFFAGKKGMLISGLVLSVINYELNYRYFGVWQLIIIMCVLLAVLLDLILDKKTENLRVIKVATGSIILLLTAPIFFSIIPAFLLWAILVGIPLGFTYRQLPKYVYIQIIVRFIFALGWIIIGNLIHNL